MTTFFFQSSSVLTFSIAAFDRDPPRFDAPPRLGFLPRVFAGASSNSSSFSSSTAITGSCCCSFSAVVVGADFIETSFVKEEGIEEEDVMICAEMERRIERSASDSFIDASSRSASDDFEVSGAAEDWSRIDC